MTELGFDAVVHAGGIAPSNAKTDPALTGALTAVSFQHPALAGRTIVRLVEESLDGAIAAEMDVLGFSRSGDAVPVGRTRKRALGFPAWALVHHPKKAAFALDVMRDFRKAAARVRTKPGHARDAFLEIGKRLERSVPAFMPSFWEQVGRVFLTEDATSFAAQSFEKARAAERGYKLAVDEDLRAAAYLEFTTAGAVPAKSLIGYAADLTQAFGAEEAARRFVRLNVQRIKAGLPPWTGMAKEITKLAKAAKLATLEAEMVQEVVGSAALKKAAPDFWTATRPLLLDLAKRSADVQKKLTFLFPVPRGFDKFLPTWIGLLEEIGAVDALKHAPAADVARFLEALTRYVTHRERNDESDIDARYFTMLSALAPVLVAAKQPVDLQVDGWDDDGTYVPDILETALELGLELVSPKRGATVDYGPRFRKNHERLLAHAAFRTSVDEGIARAFGNDDFEADAKGKSALVEPRRAFLMKSVRALEQGALPRVRSALAVLRDHAKPAHFVEFPEAKAALETIDVGKALARTVRGGLFDELTWPAFEAALAGFGPKAEIETYGTLQHPILRAGRKVVVFDGPDKLKDYDLPPAAKDVQNLLFLDGDLFIEYDDDENDRHGMWAKSPKAPFALDTNYYGDAPLCATPIAGGGVTLGAGPAWHAGDTPKTIAEEEHSSDGTTFWRGRSSWHERLKLLELDPKTGKTGRASWPELARGASEATDGLRLVEVWVTPLPKAKASPFGFKDGLIGHVRRSSEDDERFELLRIDGARWTAYAIDRLIDWPGFEQPRGLVESEAWSRSRADEFALHSPDDGEPTGTFGSGGWRTASFRVMPRASWLHYVSARDLDASRELRAMSDEVARALLHALADASVDPDDDEEDDDDDDDVEDDAAVLELALDAIRTHWPALKNPALRQAVALVTRVAAGITAQVRRLQQNGASAASVGGLEDDRVKAALPLFPTAGWHDGACTVDMAHVATAFRSGETNKLTGSCIAWETAVDRLVPMACWAASRTTDHAHRATLRELLEGFVASGLMGLELTVATLEVPTKSSLLERPKNQETWIATVGDARWFVRMEDFDEDEPRQDVVVLAETSRFVLPKDATVKEQRTFRVADQKDFVEGFLRELDARGPAAHDPAAVAWIAEQSPLNATEATLLLAGLPRFHSYDHDFLGKELRTELGVKVTDAARAKERLQQLPDAQLAELVAGMGAVEDATAFWEPATSPHGVGAALVATAKRIFGSSVTIPEELVDLLKKEQVALGERKALTLLFTATDPDNAMLRLPEKPSGWITVPQSDRTFGNAALESTAVMLPFLSAHLPVGDAARSALPALYQRVHALLSLPETIVELGSEWDDDAKVRNALLEKVGGKTVEIESDGKKQSGRDNGTVLAMHGGEWVSLAVRTSRLRSHASAVAPFLDAQPDNDDGDGMYVDDVAKCAHYLMSAECEALVARIADTPVRAGAYELAPLESVPKLVATAAKELGVDEDAAALYLQTLTLPAPTKKLVMQLNDWTAARYQKAATTLVKKKLLLEGKRERAGRDVFLPGAWEKNVGGVPMETYRARLYDLQRFDRPMLLVPAHEAFATAWKRWSSGDKPGFEDVEKKPKKKTK